MLNYIKTGTGSKHIIFIHGNSQSAESWIEVINSSALKNYTNIAIDLPGHGESFKSTDPINDYCYQGLTKHVEDFIINDQAESFIIVGLSLGTNIIGELKSEFKKCKGIMLISSCVVGKGLQVSDVLDIANPNLPTCFTANPSDEEIEALIADAADTKSREGKEKIKKDFITTDPLFRLTMATAKDDTNEIENIENRRIPIAVVFGENEKLCFKDYLDKIEFKKWKNKTITIADAGHCMQYDQPETLANLVSDFAKDCF